MSNDFLTSEFGSSKPAMARAVSVLFGGALLFLSGLTSAAFMWRYASGVFDFISPTFSPYMAALTGVLCFEAASVAWSWLKAHDSDTAVQLATANVGAWSAMVGGLVITAVYFMLNSDLISGRLDATSEMTVSIIGGLLIVLGIGGNFALGFVYRNAGAGHTAASQAAELRAMQSLAKHTARQETTRATLAKTIEEIRRGLPEHSQRQGATNAASFMAENFSDDGTSTVGHGNGRPNGFTLVDIDRQANGKANPTAGR